MSFRSRSPSPHRREFPNSRRSRSPPPRKREYEYERRGSPVRRRDHEEYRRHSRSPRRKEYEDFDDRRFRSPPRRSRSPPKKVYGTDRDRRGATTLFIGNLPYHFREKDVADYFERCGRIRNITVGVNRRTGQSKGYAFVEFEDRRDAEDAFERFDNYSLGGRRLRLDWDIGLDKKVHTYGRRRGSNRPRRHSRSPRSKSPRRGSKSPPKTELPDRPRSVVPSPTRPSPSLQPTHTPRRTPQRSPQPSPPRTPQRSPGAASPKPNAQTTPPRSPQLSPQPSPRRSPLPDDQTRSETPGDEKDATISKSPTTY